jgi:hypothetical protein
LDQSFGNRCGWKVGVNDDEFVTMAHRRERVQQIGVQQWVDSFEQRVTLP